MPDEINLQPSIPAPSACPNSNPDFIGNDANNVAIADAITAIFAAMHAQPDHTNLNKWACLALTSIARGNSVYCFNRSVANLISIPEVGILTSILSNTHVFFAQIHSFPTSHNYRSHNITVFISQCIPIIMKCGICRLEFYHGPLILTRTPFKSLYFLMSSHHTQNIQRSFLFC